jgi:hypothetical protein
MYTVIRFVAESTDSPEVLARIGALLNESVHGAFERPDRVGGRFSVSLSTAGTWEAHESAIGEFIRTADGAIAQARLSHVSVEIDVAVEPEDISGRPYRSISVSPPLMAQLSPKA